MYSHLKKQEKKILNKQLILTPKAIRERKKKAKHNVSRWQEFKEFIKIWAEISEIEMMKKIAKINETESWLFEKNKQNW